MVPNEKPVIDFATKIVSSMVEYVQAEYDPSFNITLTLSWGVKRRSSLGGTRSSIGPTANLVVRRFSDAITTGSLVDEFEYKHIQNDPVIGELKGVHWTQALASLAAHEVAHAVQLYPKTKKAAQHKLGVDNLDPRNSILAGHDWFWQRIYADLRTKFVNGNAYLKFPTSSVQLNAVKIVRPWVQADPKAVAAKKGWAVKEVNKNGGRYLFHYREDGSVIGCLFNRWKGLVYIYSTDAGTYTSTGTTDIREARRLAFNL